MNSKAIHGRGLFAKNPIRRGEKVLVFGGAKIDRDFVNWVALNIGDYTIQIDDFHHIGPTRKSDIRKAHLINHSCLPNLGFSNFNTLIALRDIQKGEELTFDYAFCTSDGFWMKCKCGTLNCRQVITGSDWQNPNLQKQYFKYFSPYLKGKINKKINSY